MNLVETILVFAVIPLVIYGLVGVATLRSKSAGARRYRPGQPWEYPPLWWTANPDGVGSGHRPAGASSATSAISSTARGGAHGTW